jgi:hypothetical protein
MPDLTKDNDRLQAEGRALLRDNQTGGGRHRQALATGPAIGAGSQRLRKANWWLRAKLIALTVGAIFVASTVAGLIMNGIGFAGIVITFLAIVAAVVIFGQYPRVKLPSRADLTRTQDARQLVARTELWLEQQRPALPAPAVRLVEDIGVQLDALGAQLAHVDPAHPAAGETRKLVGEVLPEMIDAYRRIPANLRTETRAGSTPDQQLVDSLTKIGAEIDHVTRQLAEGSLDDLAIRSRYLDYKYGSADGTPNPETN